VYSHGELARMASAKGDYETASKEMKAALVNAPEVCEPGIQRMIARLEKKGRHQSLISRDWP